MKSKILTLSMIFILSLGLRNTAFAAPEIVGEGAVFDADYYADNNPDVVAVYGRDASLLWQHFVTNGASEGRLPFAPETDWQAILAAGQTTNLTTAIDNTQVETEVVADATTDYEIYSTVYGFGDDVVSNIAVGDGIYRVHFTYKGKHNFIVWSYDAYYDKKLLANGVGNYDGYGYLVGEAPFSFEIHSNGNWSFTIERLGYIPMQAISGRGDYVSHMFSGTTSTWEFTHDGKSNFIVWLYTDNGKQDLAANAVGRYDGKKILTFPEENTSFFVVKSDGNWTMTPLY